METLPAEHWTTRLFAQETQRRLADAAKRGVTVLPLTLGGASAPVVVYGVYRRGRMVARCTDLSDAAEVAAALARYRQIS